MSPIMHILLLCAFSLGCLAMAKPSKTTAVSSTVVVETPIPIIPPLYFISQVAEFDNIDGIDDTGTGPVGANGIYQNLKWNGFGLVESRVVEDIQSSIFGEPAIVPHSAPNLIRFAESDYQTRHEGTPTITVNYGDSTITAMTLSSMYYACASITEESPAALPVTCTITVTGYGPPSAGSPQLATQSFVFVSNGGLTQDMVQGTFDGKFKGLYNAVFTLEADDVNATTALIDNVANIVYTASPVGAN